MVNDVATRYPGLIVPADSPLRPEDVRSPEDARELSDVIPAQSVPARSGTLTRPALRARAPWSTTARAAKRVVDVVVAALLLCLTAPLVLGAMLAVALESPGGPVFSQERIGLNGRRFRMHKIRSMRVGTDDAHRAYTALLIRGGEVADESGVFKLTNDVRITRRGRFIRKYSIDELPQLWNVLRGEMSLVGPRPALAYEVELYDQTALRRLAVKPGMTGLWQVSGRCRLSFAEMVALDLRYIERWSVLQDVVILARTPFAALFSRGAA